MVEPNEVRCGDVRAGAGDAAAPGRVEAVRRRPGGAGGASNTSYGVWVGARAWAITQRTRNKRAAPGGEPGAKRRGGCDLRRSLLLFQAVIVGGDGNNDDYEVYKSALNNS